MGDVSAEPTMEEILSSIKRVIEESEAAPTAARSRRAARTVAADIRDAADEVLELNERVPFPEAPREPLPLPRAEDALTPEAEVEPPPVSAHVAGARTESIVSRDAVTATRGSLEALSRLVVKPEVTGADTLEGMVREMLRPMLREWLDTNLPEIVERMVAKEIARIAGR